jgi:hypothetical protein
VTHDVRQSLAVGPPPAQGVHRVGVVRGLWGPHGAPGLARGESGAAAPSAAPWRRRLPTSPSPGGAAPGLTRYAVVLRRGAGQAARQVRGELRGVAVAARNAQRPRRIHPAHRLRPRRPGGQVVPRRRTVATH